MRVLVTGGAGHVGKATIERLVQNGWEVRAIDLTSGVELNGAEYVACDILDYDRLREQMRGCQAIIHLAAIRSPSTAPGYQVFEVNVMGTFKVFEAAAAEGIKRVVQASSINAIGCAYNLTDVSPQYFPIDEAHPSFTSDPYSFSKQAIEEIGAYYWRREGISSVALRFPWVYPRDYPQSEAFQKRRQLAGQTLDDLLARPEAEQQALLADARKRTLEYRAARPMEFADGKPATWRPPQSADPLWFAYNGDRFNFWAMIDERDAAQSLEKGLTAGYEGSHALFANDAYNWLGCDSETLLRLFFPEVRQRKQALTGAESLVSIARARNLIGFAPEFSLHGGAS